MARGSGGPASAVPFVASMVDADAFWSRVDRSGECWKWLGPRNVHGYGAMTVGALRRSPVAAHRVAYVLTHGTIESGMSVLHSCDVRLCVNPAHLRAGTHTENMQDRTDRYRGGALFMKGATANALKTHCKSGHPFDEANTRTSQRGRYMRRECRACQRNWTRNNRSTAA